MRGAKVENTSTGSVPTVCGVGIVDSPTTEVDGSRKLAYLAWKDMLRRCYSKERNASYARYGGRGVLVCPDWLTFSVFEAWYHKHYRSGYHLDKDILVSGNNMYGPTTCCYVPPALNALLTNRARARGSLPQGVTRALRDGKVMYLVATIHKYGVMHAIAWGHDPQALHESYKKAKAAHIREVARTYYSGGFIGRHVRDALFRIAREFTFVDDRHQRS